MKRTLSCILFAFATLMLGSCGGTIDNKPPANASNASNANSNATKPVAAAPTKEALMALERNAHEAWKNKDGKFFEGIMTDNFVMFGRAGRIDKAAAIKEIAESKCEVKSYSISDDQMMAAGNDAAVTTFKTTADVTCEGQKMPSPVWAATIWVRSGDSWKAVYHNEAPIPDPNAKPGPPAPPAKAAETEAKPDALTEALLAVEKKGWDAWKARDAKPVEEMFSKDFMYFSASGRMNKAEAIKSWFESKCDIKSYSLTEPKGVSLNSNTAVLTFRGNAAGTCDGKPLMNLWGTTLMMKEGDVWRPIFYMDSM